jgi:hypothetical protein
MRLMADENLCFNSSARAELPPSYTATFRCYRVVNEGVAAVVERPSLPESPSMRDRVNVACAPISDNTAKAERRRARMPCGALPNG